MINGLNLNYDFVSQRVGLVKEDGIITSAYLCMRVRPNQNPIYYCYLLKTMDSRKMFHGMGTGIRLTLSYNELRNFLLPVPPLPEQEQIVRFLDWKLSEINRLNANKKKMLSILQELVNSLFNTISTRSITSTRLKNIVDICDDFIDIQPEEQYMKTGMYNRGRGIFRRDAILGKNMGDSKFQTIQSNCVMISGQFAWEAATYITTKEDEVGVASHRYYLLKPKNGIPAEYIWGFLISEYGQMILKLCSHGAAGRNRPLNIKELLNERIPIPRKEDRNQVVLLSKTIQALMKMRKIYKAESEILNELKIRLISDVVTGKRDVRDVEIPEYEYTEAESLVASEDLSEDLEDEAHDEER